MKAVGYRWLRCMCNATTPRRIIRLLILALRVLTLLEGVVRQRLGEPEGRTAGLFASNHKGPIAQLTAERLLEAFSEVTLKVVSALGFAQ